jgi:DNA-directed RNA polymerase specialized sigma24 family protein
MGPLEACSLSEDLEDLFTREYANIVRTIARIIRDAGRAEELAVDVFLKLSAGPKARSVGAKGVLYRQANRRENVASIQMDARNLAGPNRQFC